MSKKFCDKASEVSIQNLEGFGIVVRESLDDNGYGWQVQANIGDRVIYQGRSGDRFDAFSWGYCNGREDQKES